MSSELSIEDVRRYCERQLERSDAVYEQRKPVTEQDRYDANIGAYVQAATARADRAEAALQVARAEAAALRDALQLVSEAWHDESVDPGVTDGVFLARMRTSIIPRVAAALSGDAGAAFLAEREREAMRLYLERARPILQALLDAALEAGARYDNPSVTITLDPEWAVKARSWLRFTDALSAPAAEPCCRTPDPSDCCCQDRRRR